MSLFGATVLKNITRIFFQTELSLPVLEDWI